MSFHVRSTFAFASVQVSLDRQADQDRFTVLPLKERAEQAASDQGALSRDIASLQQGQWGEHLRSTVLLDWKRLLNDIETFRQAGASILNDRRKADQIGTLLGGAYFATHSTPATIADATRRFTIEDWHDHVAPEQETDANSALRQLMSLVVKMPSGEVREKTIGTLVKAAWEPGNPSNDEIIRMYGMKVGLPRRKDVLVVDTSNVQLRSLLKNSMYRADLWGALSRLPGAKATQDRTTFAPGVRAKGVVIPIELVLPPEESAESENSRSP